MFQMKLKYNFKKTLNTWHSLSYRNFHNARFATVYISIVSHFYQMLFINATVLLIRCVKNQNYRNFKRSYGTYEFGLHIKFFNQKQIKKFAIEKMS